MKKPKLFMKVELSKFLSVVYHTEYMEKKTRNNFIKPRKDIVGITKNGFYLN